MPSLKDATKKPANVGEPIEVAAPRVTQGTPPPPYVPNNRGDAGLAVGSMGPAPAVFSSEYDRVKQFIRPGTSQSRFPPLPLKVNPQGNAQSSSIATKQIAPVHKQTQANTAAIAAVAAQPGPVSALAVAKSVFKDSTGVLHQAIELSFTPPPIDLSGLLGTFAGTSIWVTYPGDEPRGATTGTTSPVIFLLPIDGTTVTLTVQSYSVNGVDNDFSSCPTINVTLDGVTTAPAAPTITSFLAPSNAGVTFTFQYATDPLHDVIQGYNIYKNSVNNPATATIIKNVPQPATGVGTYAFNDMTPAGSIYYYWVTALNLQQLESAKTNAQTGAVQSGTIGYQGAYSGSLTYYPGTSVTYGGQFYTCILTSTGNLPTNATYWQSTGSSSNDVFLGGWSSIVNYVPGNQVTTTGGGAGYYICILASLNDPPASSPTKWQIVGSVSTYTYMGAYNGGTSYVPGNQTSYLGSYWLCISNSTGNAPDINSSFWVNVGTSAIFEGAWSSLVTYPQNSQVQYAGNVFVALQLNTNQTPPTPPATSAYWALIGPETTDALANGVITFLGVQYTATAIVVPNGNFEASTSLPVPGWVGSNATLSYDTATPSSGNQSLIVTTSLQYGGALGNQKYACVPGNIYMVSGYVKSGDGVGIPDVALVFVDKNGSYLANVQAFGSTSTSWTYTYAIGAAPADTVAAYLSLQNQAVTQTSIVEFDNVDCQRLAYDTASVNGVPSATLVNAANNLFNGATWESSNNGLVTTADVGGSTSSSSWAQVGSFQIIFAPNITSYGGYITLSRADSTNYTQSAGTISGSGWGGSFPGPFTDSVLHGTSTNPLSCTNFNFGSVVPASANILGVAVSFTPGGAGLNGTLALLGVTGGTPESNWGPSGGPTDLWGTGGITRAQVVASGFGFSIIATNPNSLGSITASVSSVTITVYTDGGTFTASARIRVGANNGSSATLSGLGPTIGTSFIGTPAAGLQTVIVEAELTGGSSGTVQALFQNIEVIPLSGSQFT